MNFDVTETGKNEFRVDDAKTVTTKIITNGNCCVCGKPLDNGLFLCEKCAEMKRPKLKLKSILRTNRVIAKFATHTATNEEE